VADQNVTVELQRPDERQNSFGGVRKLELTQGRRVGSAETRQIERDAMMIGREPLHDA